MEDRDYAVETDDVSKVKRRPYSPEYMRRLREYAKHYQRQHIDPTIYASFAARRWGKSVFGRYWMQRYQDRTKQLTAEAMKRVEALITRHADSRCQPCIEPEPRAYADGFQKAVEELRGKRFSAFQSNGPLARV